MPARKLISDQCRDPEDLRKTFLAFDGAWALIADRFLHDSALADAVQLRLARIILDSPANDFRDPLQIQATSLRILALRCPELRLSRLISDVPGGGEDTPFIASQHAPT
jgi:hypothetical protein